ncbi:MAG TPA: transposase [Candidatus Aquilonibacter sp.]|nr:transposase [Candidatus Aquilonibacter sp.]
MVEPIFHKNIRLEHGYYVGRSTHFITICCESRRPVFENPARATWLIDMLRSESDTHGFAVFAYCVMPDHLHALVSGSDEGSDLLTFVRSFKGRSEYQYRLRQKIRNPPMENRPRNARATMAATNANSTRPVLWQKKFYDRILRANDNFDAVAGYIWTNPVRAGLCVDPRDYAHSGSFTVDWKNAMRPLESWIPEWKKRDLPTKKC